MSRTDKTRPYWVKIEDPYNRRYVEEKHDHRNGICDFDGTSTNYARTSIPGPKSFAWWETEKRRCVITPKLTYAGLGEFVARACGSWCVICDPAMLQNGCERMRWRALARNLLKTPVDELYDIDEWTTERRYLKRVRGEHWN